MSLEYGRLYQFLSEKLHFRPLALACAWAIRTLVRAYLLAFMALPRRRRSWTGDEIAAARERLEALFPAPAPKIRAAQVASPARELDLSILIPVYNAEAYLDACLESVYSQQTTARFEVILVDDGSGEATVERLKRYQNRAGTRVIRQENRGAAAARNAALDLAAGEYVMFVDADDALAPGAIEALMRAARAQNVDLVQGGWQYADGLSQRYPARLFRGREKLRLIDLPGMPWGKVIRRRLFANLRFPEEFTSYVDTPVKCLTLRMCRNAATISAVVYVWRRNPAGITFTSRDKPRALQTYWIMARMQAESERLKLPEDDLYCAIWLRQMLAVNYGRLKGCDARVRQDVFLLSCDFLAPVLRRAANMKLPFALRLARRAFARGDFALWQMAGKWYDFCR